MPVKTINASEQLVSLPQLGRLFGLAESTIRRRFERGGVVPDFEVSTGNGRRPMLAFKMNRIDAIRTAIAA